MRTHRALLINPRSGSGSPGADELAEAAGERGIEPVVLREGDDPAEVARGTGAEVLGMAGGDGSLAAVAQVAIDTGAAFVVIPFGTRNHFARDVGIDRDDPLGALAAYDGTETRVDVGRAGNRLFLNNVSFGAYASLVHRRERRRRRGEALARARALARSLRHPGRLHATVDGERVDARVVLVGNNNYEMSLFTVGERERLDEGCLHLWSAGGLLPTSWTERRAARFTIELRASSVRAAIDGEPVMLDSPVELESLPGALRLLLPPRGE